MIGGGAAILLLVGGIVFFTLLRPEGSSGTASTPYYGRYALADSLSSEPTEQWSFRIPNDEAGVVAHSGMTYVSYWNDDGESTIVALDDNGEESWSLSNNDYLWVNSITTDGSMLLLTPYESESDSFEVEAISTDDGSTLWTANAGYPVQMLDDGILFADEHGLSELDADGHEGWSVGTSDNFALGVGRAYSLDGNELTAIDLSTGESLWSVDTGLACSDEDYCSIAAAEGFVAVADSTEANSFNAEDGAAGWSETLSEGQTLGDAGDTVVYIETAADTENYIDGSVEFFDASGKQGETPIDVDDGYFFAMGEVTGGASYVIDLASGDVFDESFEQVGTVDGDLDPVEGGVYSLDGGRLSYFRFDDSRRVWSVQVGSGDSTQVVSDDQGVVVKVDGDLARYR